MGRSFFLLLLIVSLILALSFSTGCGRKLLGSFGGDPVFTKEVERKAGEMVVGLMDYDDPGPNFNSRSGLPNITNPSPSPNSPPPFPITD